MSSCSSFSDPHEPLHFASLLFFSSYSMKTTAAENGSMIPGQIVQVLRIAIQRVKYQGLRKTRENPCNFFFACTLFFHWRFSSLCTFRKSTSFLAHSFSPLLLTLLAPLATSSPLPFQWSLRLIGKSWRYLFSQSLSRRNVVQS